MSNERHLTWGRLTCVPKEAVPIPDLSLPDLRHVEDANAETDIVEDAVRVLLVQLVDKSLLWGKVKLGGMNRDFVLLWTKQLREWRV